MAESGSEWNPEHEGQRSAAQRDRHGPPELLLGHDVGRVRAGDRPEDPVGESAEDARGNEHRIVGGESRGQRARHEDRQHDDHERVPGHTHGQCCEERTGEHDREGEDRDREADLRFADAEIVAHLRQQSGREHLDGDAQEGGGSEGDQRKIRETFGGGRRAHRAENPFRGGVDRGRRPRDTAVRAASLPE